MGLCIWSTKIPDTFLLKVVTRIGTTAGMSPWNIKTGNIFSQVVILSIFNLIGIAIMISTYFVDENKTAYLILIDFLVALFNFIPYYNITLHGKMWKELLDLISYVDDNIGPFQTSRIILAVKVLFWMGMFLNTLLSETRDWSVNPFIPFVTFSYTWYLAVPVFVLLISISEGAMIIRTRKNLFCRALLDFVNNPSTDNTKLYKKSKILKKIYRNLHLIEQHLNACFGIQLLLLLVTCFIDYLLGVQSILENFVQGDINFGHYLSLFIVDTVRNYVL